jgi:glycosyltransferase involved in cell wall biosynthesis
MRILVLTQILPFPPDAGPRVKTWHVLRHLAEAGHELVLATFLRPEEHEYLPAVQAICREVHAIPLTRSRIADGWHWIKSNLRGRPFLIERDDKREMRALVDQLLAGGEIDAVHVDQLTMGQFVTDWMRPPATAGPDNLAMRHPGRPLIVFDAHNAVWMILNRMRRTSSLLVRPMLALETHRVKHYEGMLVAGSDFTLVVSKRDQGFLEEANRVWRGRRASATGEAEDRIRVIPIAVDTEELKPVPRRSGSKNILTLGTLHYPPNADGVRWFMTEVFPLILARVPEASMTVIGKNPPVELGRIAAGLNGRVTIEGYVADLAPYLSAAAVLVVPVRVGGGMRVRILEAFARAMPTVTTSVGLEGIEAQPGEHVLVADTADLFANHVITLLQDEVSQASLAVNGRWLAEARYERHRVLAGLDHIYGTNGRPRS